MIPLEQTPCLSSRPHVYQCVAALHPKAGSRKPDLCYTPTPTHIRSGQNLLALSNCCSPSTYPIFVPRSSIPQTLAM